VSETTVPAEAPVDETASMRFTQRLLAAATGLACTGMAVLGGVGSFDAVAKVAADHGFDHPARVPLTVDLGAVCLFLADLLFTWRGRPFPPLRWLAHLLVGATIWFNMAASAGNPLGMAMHAVAPVLLVAWVEGVRHASKVSARRVQRRSPLARWLLAPVATARLWRHQQLWNVTSYADALALERRRLLLVAKYSAKYGRRWRRMATPMERLALRFELEPERSAETPAPAGGETAAPGAARRPRVASRAPSRLGKAGGTETKKRDEMAAWALAERAKGRDVTGADLDARFGTSNYGRKVLARLPVLNGQAPVTTGEGAS
jgi:Protein of unknown function (DUF2637)